MDPQNLLPMNPNSLKARFTTTFLQSLRKMNLSSSSSSKREIFHRCRAVKIAADVSIARAAGPARAWSRALLRRQKGLAKRIKIHAFLRRNLRRKKKEEEDEDKEGKFRVLGVADELRKVVPGGEDMDLCTLLGETAHYMKCLNTQVEVMRNIVNLYPN